MWRAGSAAKFLAALHQLTVGEGYSEVANFTEFQETSAVAEPVTEAQETSSFAAMPQVARRPVPQMETSATDGQASATDGRATSATYGQATGATDGQATGATDGHGQATSATDGPTSATDGQVTSGQATSATDGQASATADAWQMDAPGMDMWVRNTFNPRICGISTVSVAQDLVGGKLGIPHLSVNLPVTKDLREVKFASVLTLPRFHLFILGKSNLWQGIHCQMEPHMQEGSWLLFDFKLKTLRHAECH